jgi:hypothetical protein
MNEWRVILVRQPFHDNVVWKAKDRPSAEQRAYALTELHGRCSASVIGASKRIWVHATAWYARKS